MLPLVTTYHQLPLGARTDSVGWKLWWWLYCCEYDSWKNFLGLLQGKQHDFWDSFYLWDGDDGGERTFSEVVSKSIQIYASLSHKQSNNDLFIVSQGPLAF